MAPAPLIPRLHFVDWCSLPAAIRRVAGTWIIPTTDKDHETLATNLGRLQIKQESHALLPSNVHVLKLILTQDILRSCY